MNCRLFAATAAFAVLCGCGAAGTRDVPSAPKPADQQSTTVVSMRIAPSKHTSGRHPAYVSPSTMGAALSVYADGATPPTQPTAVADFSPSSSNCTANTDGSRTCSISISAAPGTDEISAVLYDKAPVNGVLSGNALATGTAIQTIAAGVTNQVALTLNGVPAYVQLSLDPAYITSGVAQTAQLAVQVQDADHNLITGPGNYSTPIALTNSDSSGAFTLSTGTLTDPAVQFVTVQYSGAPAPSSVTFGATAGGVSASAVTKASLALIAPSKVVLNPTNVAFAGVGGGNVQTIDVSEANYSGAFTASSASCGNIVTLTSSTSSNAQFSFQSAGVGTCTFTISDGVNSQTLPFSVQIQPFTVSPAQLTFLDTTSTQTVTASEPKYPGTFTYDVASSTCLNTASGSGKAMVTTSDGLHFTVQGSQAGACTVVFHDSNAGAAPQSATLNVSVTTTTVGGQ